MPTFNFGDKLDNIDRASNFIELKSKGEKVHIRILPGTYYYDATHFVEKPGEGKGGKSAWDVFKCPRIMKGEDCAECQKYFDAVEESKNEKDEKKAKKIKDEARREFYPDIKFYYPVLDREAEEAGIFKTTLGVRLKLEREMENGIDVLEYDYIVTRTENPGTDYYSLTRLDSKQIKDLTAKEQEEVMRAASWDLAKTLGAKQSESSFEEPPIPEEPDA